MKIKTFFFGQIVAFIQKNINILYTYTVKMEKMTIKCNGSNVDRSLEQKSK